MNDTNTGKTETETETRTHKRGFDTMTNKMAKMVMVTMMVLSAMMMVGCDGTDENVTTDMAPEPTAIPVGDDTLTELVDDIRKTDTSALDKLDAINGLLGIGDTIDDCFTQCDTDYPNNNGNKTSGNLDCVAQCKTEYAE